MFKKDLVQIGSLQAEFCSLYIECILEYEYRDYLKNCWKYAKISLHIFVLFLNFLSFKKNLVQIGSLQAEFCSLYIECILECEYRKYLKN